MDDLLPPDRSSEDQALFDQALRVAMRDVSIPPGLADRLQARLDAVAGAPVAPRAARRRWLLGAGAALTACAASGLIAWFAWPASVELGPEAIMNVARAWCDEQPTAEEQRKADENPPARFAYADVVAARSMLAWHALHGAMLDRDGVAYELLGRGGHRAKLLVLELHGSLRAPKLWHLPSSPTDSIMTTAGRTSAVWTDGARLFVLVVDGDANALRSFVREQGTMA